MKTELELKKLAEFAAEFLGWEIEDGRLSIPSFCLRVGLYLCDDPHVKYIFEHPETAPILAHLAKREMEKREFEWELATIWIKPGIRGYQCEVYGFEKNNYSTEVVCSHENEYIAFWSAVMEAVKDGS